MNDFLLFYFEPEEYLNTNKINSKRCIKDLNIKLNEYFLTNEEKYETEIKFY